jgi:hypothetical protein
MWKLWKSRQMKTKHSAMKLSQIRRRIELCLRGNITLFWDEFLRKKNFLDSSIHICILKKVPKYLATGLYRRSGINSSPAEVLTKGLKCKTNTLPTLMHQMSILINQVSSLMLGSINLEIRKRKLWNMWKRRTPNSVP